MVEKLSDKVYRETYEKYKCVPAEFVHIIEGIKELEDALARVEALSLQWNNPVFPFHVRDCGIQLTEALHPKSSTEKGKKTEKIMRESIGLVEKKPRWRYDCDRCGKGCKYSPTDTPPCSNMPTVKDWSIAQKKRAIA